MNYEYDMIIIIIKFMIKVFFINLMMLDLFVVGLKKMSWLYFELDLELEWF
jgi:hypothetical protein